jgi:hypothetical protein
MTTLLQFHQKNTGFMMSRLLLILILPVFLLASMDNDRALKMMKTEQRVALVIGNNQYGHKRLLPLQNPVNDARAMKTKLETLGFTVIYGEDLTVRQMDKKVNQFAGKLKSGGVGLFFFAGHGIEYNGVNYLMGKDSNLDIAEDVKYESLSLNKTLDVMQNAGNRFNMVFLDACRNDPFSRSSGGGLAKSTARGTFIAYATSPGDVASDGNGRNGVFTENILKYIDKPGEPIEQVFKNIKRGVIASTGNKQRPWVHNDFVGDFFFRLPDGQASSKPALNTPSSFSFQEVKRSEFSLTVNTTPADAKVAITNINPVYHDGIMLKRGKYTVKVSKDGYYSKTGNIDLQNDMNINISLRAQKSSHKPSNKKTHKTPVTVPDEYKLEKDDLVAIGNEKFIIKIDTLGRISSFKLKKNGIPVELIPDMGRRPLQIMFDVNYIQSESERVPYHSDKPYLNVTHGPKKIKLTQKLSDLTVQKVLTIYPDGHFDVQIELSKSASIYIGGTYIPDITATVLLNDNSKYTFESGEVEGRTSFKNTNFVALSNTEYCIVMYDLPKNMDVCIERNIDDNPVGYFRANRPIKFSGYIGEKHKEKMQELDESLVKLIDNSFFSGIKSFF